MGKIFEAIKGEINLQEVNSIITYSRLMRVATNYATKNRLSHKCSKRTVYTYIRLIKSLGYISKIDNTYLKILKHIPEELGYLELSIIANNKKSI